jgi:hypothetical protein
MVALVLACVHAARGDGRGITTFSSGSRLGAGTQTASAASSTASHGGGGIITVHGDPWRPGPDSHSSASQSRATPGHAPAYRAARGTPGAHDEPICIVHRPGAPAGAQPTPAPAPDPRELALIRSIPLKALPPGQFGPPAPMVLMSTQTLASSGHAAPMARNAFYLSPVMGAGMP